MNHHCVIYIDFSRIPQNCDAYYAYIGRILDGLKEDLMGEYPCLGLDPHRALRDMLQIVFDQTGQCFIFVMDEWDAVFHKDFISENDRYVCQTPDPRITREELAFWYDGYHTASGDRIYTPRSEVCALTDNQISNYWTSSGPYDEIFYYIHNNIDHVRDDLAC